MWLYLRGSPSAQHLRYDQIRQSVYSTDHHESIPTHLHGHETRLSDLLQRRAFCFIIISISIRANVLVFRETKTTLNCIHARTEWTTHFGAHYLPLLCYFLFFSWVGVDTCRYLKTVELTNRERITWSSYSFGSHRWKWPLTNDFHIRMATHWCR